MQVATSHAMNSIAVAPADDPAEQDRTFQATFAAVREARARLVNVRPHRAMTPLNVTPYLLAQALVLPLVLCALLYWAKPALVDLWRECILFWSDHLGLQFSLSAQVNEAGQHTLRLPEGLGGTPSAFIMGVTALVTLAALALSFGMKHAALPLKYPIRIAAVIQFVTLLFFWFAPSEFPYSIARHSEELMTIGYAVMLATPLMLAVGYYILNQSLPIKLFHTALILLFLAVMVPHQVLIQALIMQHLSMLFMPLLYICFGAVFDALVFVALYSWAVSNAPADATT